jgi:hypothetical protein
MADWTDESVARMHQGVAFVFSQSVAALAEIEAMKALNAERQDKGLAQAYGEEAFAEVANKYGIHHNAVLSTFEQYS